MTSPANRDRERSQDANTSCEQATISQEIFARPRTVGEAIARDLMEMRVGEDEVVFDSDLFREGVADGICAVLGLDPAEPLDGPVVVLHPGEKAIRPHIVTADDHPPLFIEFGIDERGQETYLPWAVVASNPEVQP